jgi:hypothetical protein
MDLLTPITFLQDNLTLVIDRLKAGLREMVELGEIWEWEAAPYASVAPLQRPENLSGIRTTDNSTITTVAPGLYGAVWQNKMMLEYGCAVSNGGKRPAK